MKLSLLTLTFLTGSALATWGTGGGDGGDDGDDDKCKDSGYEGGWKRLLNGRTWGHGGGDKDCTTEGSGEKTKTHGHGGGGGGEMTYSTIYATSTHTITSCAPDVDDCPGEQYTTVTVAVSTTLCPVTETQPIPVVTPPVATPPAQTTPIATPPAPPVVPSVVPSQKPSTPVVVPPVPTTPATLSTRTTLRPTNTIPPSNGTTTATRPPVVTAGAASNGVGAGVALAALLAAMV